MKNTERRHEKEYCLCCFEILCAEKEFGRKKTKRQVLLIYQKLIL